MFLAQKNDGSLKFDFYRTPVNELNLPIDAIIKGRKRYKKYRVFIPSNLDINEFFDDERPFNGFDLDKCHYLIGLIHEIKAYKPDEYNSADYVSICSFLLKEVGIRDYSKYFAWLVEKGVIEIDANYSRSDSTCKKYRFNKQYKATLKPLEIQKNSLNKSIWVLKARLNYCSSIVIHQPTPTRNHLYSFLKDLKIDLIKAKTIMKARLLAEIKNSNKSQKISAMDRFNSATISSNKIDNNDFFLKVDNTSYRYHSNITNLSRELRNTLSWKSQPLFEIDIKNSQPYFTAHKLTPPPTQPKDSKSIMWAKMYQTEYDDYMEVVSNGALYEEVQACAIELGVIDKDNPEGRQIVKDGVIQFLYGKKYEMTKIARTIGPALFKRFPLITQKITELQSQLGNLLPISIQRAESDFIYNRVIARIMIEKPKVPLFTIHDSIATTEENVTYVKQIIEEEALKLYPKAPKLSVKKWGNALMIAKGYLSEIKNHEFKSKAS